MSEDDYQRGLRGGSCPVSTIEWERWSDWKAGNREYERAQDERHSVLINSFDESPPATRNLGDYECPHCLQISLKRGASRCPMCHGSVGDDYWNRVQARDNAEAEIVREAAKITEERQRAATERRKCAEEAAVAEIRYATEEWARGWLAARQRKENQGFLDRTFKPVNVPETIRLEVSTWDTSYLGTWTLQPVIRMDEREYRFATPHEYIAALEYLKTLQATICDPAIARLRGVLNEDWQWPALEVSRARLKEVAVARATAAKASVHAANLGVRSAAEIAAVNAVMVPILECKRLREIEKITPSFCGWNLSRWTAHQGRWQKQPVLKVCLGNEYRFATPHEYVAALVEMRKLWKYAEGEDPLGIALASLQEQKIVWDRYH